MKQLQDNINARIEEVNGYQTNIDNYSEMLTTLPDSLSEELMEFSSANPSELHLDFESIATISDYQFGQKLRVLLLTERLEQRKSQCILDALRRRLDRIPYVD